MNIPQTDLPRVVIIGAGFAGLNLAKKLNPNKYQIVLLDRNNYHLFQPLMYQVATAGLEPDAIAYPIRKIFQKKKHTHVRYLEVEEIDLHGKTVTTNKGKLFFDKLVIATGAKNNFFGMEDIETNSMPMKSLPQSLNIRH